MSSGQIQIVDKQTASISDLNERFQMILDTPVPADREGRLKRLEDMEQLAFGFFGQASNLYERGWAIIFLIIEEGLWRGKTDPNGNYFVDYASYVQSLYEMIGKYISVRTVYSRVSEFRALGELDIDAATRVRVLEDQPHMVKKLMHAVVGQDGEIKRLEPAARKEILEHVGISGIGATEMTDKEVVGEFIKVMPDMPHKDSSNIISRLIREWKKNYTWFKRERIFVVRFYQAGINSKKKPELRFQLIGGDVDHPEAKKWLEGMTQG